MMSPVSTQPMLVADMFVLFDTYAQLAHIKDINKRTAETLRRSAKAMFITSFTTAVAFLANMYSVIPAIRYFGLFIAVMVVCPVFGIW